MPQRNKLTGKSWPAPAKLNLYLHVTGRRPDGYHELQTLFQLLDWGDELSFSVTNDGRISRECNIDSIAETQDICVEAARRLQAISGTGQGVHIDLTKNIPTGSGLGGGSSDAATTLVALNELWSCGLEMHELETLGLSLYIQAILAVKTGTASYRPQGSKKGRLYRDPKPGDILTLW